MLNITQELQKIKITKDIKSFVSLVTRAILTRTELVPILNQILQISSIEFTDKIPTAAIEYKLGKYYLWFNLEFITKYVKTTDCLLFIVLHELYHKLYGDLFLGLQYKYENINRKFLNIVCDLKINSDLYKTFFKDSTLPPIIENLYLKDKTNIISKLFCPPEILLKHNPQILLKLRNNFSKTLPEDVIKKINQELVEETPYKNNKFIAQLAVDNYCYIWLRKKGETSFVEMFNLLYKLIQLIMPDKDKLEIILRDIPFIGSQVNCDKYKDTNNCQTCKENQSCPYKSSSLPSYIIEKLKEAIGYSNKITTTKLNKINKFKSKTFYNAVLKAISIDYSHPVVKEQMFPEYGFIPQFTRKETFLISSGFIPIVYQTLLTKKEYDEMKLHIYIDLSGSTELLWELYYGLILALYELIGMPVYLFSNQVEEAKLEDIKEGKIKTTFGTDINCVIQHALKRNFYRILLLTDGFVEVNNTNVELAKRKPIKFYVVFAYEELLRRSIYFKKNYVPNSKLFTTGLLSPTDRNRTWWLLQDYIKV
ncbi:MAG: hypothetical protein NZ928_04920 [Endomicrobia bacterium]|nr:hypothetical protein [Endomicrobiia bacterium]MDW8056125.1 hypothetical protein [Elusimicrobiota bacterium]